MRIGVVTTSYPRTPGDPAGCFVAELSDWIASRGHRVEVIAAGDPGIDDSWQSLPVRRVSAAPGLFYEGGAPDALRGGRAALDAVRFGARLAREVRLRSAHWDGIVAHWLVPSALAASMVASQLPLWAIAHGGDVHLLRKLGLTRPTARLLLRPSVHVNFVSQALREAFAECGGRLGRRLADRSSTLSMGVNLEHFEQLPSLRQQNDEPLLLFLGRLVPIKGADVLLDALAETRANLQVVIAGDGPERARLEKKARGLGLDVSFPGEVQGADRDALLARANLVVIPSRPFRGRSEGMPRVALEALACGAELVVTDTGGLAEMPESICHRVAADDPRALARVIETVAAGRQAAYAPGHWLEERGWNALAPRMLPGIGHGS